MDPMITFEFMLTCFSFRRDSRILVDFEFVYLLEVNFRSIEVTGLLIGIFFFS